MKQEYVAVIAVLSLSSCILQAYGQDIIFPGETERPSRYPLNPNNPNNSNNSNDSNDSNNPNNPNNSNNSNNPNNPNGGISQEEYNTCVNNCGFTSEYNPVCGSDGVTYQNVGALNCAVNCGNPIRNLGSAPCSTTTPNPVTPSTNDQTGQNGQITLEQYNSCVDNCRFTSEYNPVCGSDGVTYQNVGSLNCALNCGNPIQNLGRAPCNQYFSTTTPSG